MNSNRDASRLVVFAMLCAGVVTAQYVVAKATRDALFLNNFNYTALPTMYIAASAVSIVLVLANSKSAGRIAPSRLVPALFAVSGAVFGVEWLLIDRLPRATAILVYLHTTGAGPLLGSGFWLVLSERFDPRTAKRRYGQIAGVGTLGGLAGALAADRLGSAFGIPGVLLFLAAVTLACAGLVRRLAPPAAGSPVGPRGAARSGLGVLADAPYLQNLAVLVLIGTTSAAFADYVLKASVAETFARADRLRFFIIYSSATALATFLIQALASRSILERFGLAAAASTPSVAIVAGGAGALLAPGFATVLLMRAAETVCRGSLFRSGYELFFTPIPAIEKRAVKSVIDVGFDRLGDAVAGGVLRVVIFAVLPAARFPVVLSLAVGCSLVAMLFASRLNRGYIHALERGLMQRALDLDLADVEDLTTRTIMLRTLGGQVADAPPRMTGRDRRASTDGAIAASLDPELQAIVVLRSRDQGALTKLLHNERGIAPALVPHVIPLLAWNPVAEDAIFALRKVAEERVGELVDALIDPNQEFAVRRRLARVFSVCVSQRAADGLMLGLDDLRFEVRFQCARSLAAIVEKNFTIRMDKEKVFAFVLREVAVGKPVWESRRLLDSLESNDLASFVDTFVRDRASQSLAHVFTLLSLVLPREPLQIAFRGLQTDDQGLRGTALEYLEGILPAEIRDRLWPFLEDRRPSAQRAGRPREEILADLLRSNRSIMLNLEELRRRTGGAESPVAAGTSRDSGV